MREKINQRVVDGADSICKTCTHERVCIGTINQPCVECDQYAKKPKVGHWVKRGGELYCSACSSESGYGPMGSPAMSKYCPACGAPMEA